MVVCCGGIPTLAAGRGLNKVFEPFDDFLRRYGSHSYVYGSAGLRRFRIDCGRLRNAQAWPAFVDSLTTVREIDLKTASKSSVLAFWINSYNVLTVDAICRNWPLRGTLLEDDEAAAHTLFIGEEAMGFSQIKEQITALNRPEAMVMLYTARLGAPGLPEKALASATIDAAINMRLRELVSNPGLFDLDTESRILRLSKWWTELNDQLVAASISVPSGLQSYPRETSLLLGFLWPHLSTEVRQQITSLKPCIEWAEVDTRLF